MSVKRLHIKTVQTGDVQTLHNVSELMFTLRQS